MGNRQIIPQGQFPLVGAQPQPQGQVPLVGAQPQPPAPIALGEKLTAYGYVALLATADTLTIYQFVQAPSTKDIVSTTVLVIVGTRALLEVVNQRVRGIPTLLWWFSSGTLATMALTSAFS